MESLAEGLLCYLFLLEAHQLSQCLIIPERCLNIWASWGWVGLPKAHKAPTPVIRCGQGTPELKGRLEEM